MIDELISIISGEKPRNQESEELLKRMAIQNLMETINVANLISQKATHKVLSDIVDETLGIKKRHRILHV